MTPSVEALVRFGLNSPDAARLARFYQQAFEARLLVRERWSAQTLVRSHGITGGAVCITLALGETTLEILEFDSPGAPYPTALPPQDCRFQHFAIVVDDMPRAMQALSRTEGWTPLSIGGPQRLPERAGGVTAFKFRDPDGHPLELLQFPAGGVPAHWRGKTGTGNHAGIDHSALSVADARRSIDFYESLGLAVVATTLNHGPEQQALDGVSDPVVDVIGLAPRMPTPHVELLHYRTRARPPSAGLAANDVAATRLIFTPAPSPSDQPFTAGLVRDPDGHFIDIRSDLGCKTGAGTADR